VPGQHHVWNNVKKPLIIAVTGIAASAALGAGVFTAAHKTITLDIDGQTTHVSTFSGSVGGLLKEQGITLADGDLVAPSTSESLTEGSEVVVRYQREVTLDHNGTKETLKTTAVDAEELLDSLAARGEENVRLVASRSRGTDRVDIGLRLNNDGPVAILVDGKNTVVDAKAGNVEDIIKAQGIVLGDDDRVSIQNLAPGATSVPEFSAADAKADAKIDAKADNKSAKNDSLRVALDGAASSSSEATMVTLVVQRVDTQTTTSKSVLDFKTVTKKDANRYADQGSYVATAGKNGTQTKTYEIVTVDGVVESKTAISTEVTAEPVNKVVVVGTKARPVVKAPTKASSSSSGSSSSSSSGTVAAGGAWAALAKCESGGNPRTNTGNGYYGLYQFSLSTWRSLGGTGLPSDASAAEQTRIAQKLQARSGWGQWPACSRKLGLR